MAELDLIRDLLILQDQQDQYIRIPFEMPPGIARLEVTYTVTARGPGLAMVDLGCLEGDTVRGWSGWARKGFTIGEAKASPGYLTGSLTPGPWAVLLGAYRVPAEGLRCQVAIRLHPRERRWYKGDLHHHTHHSDGSHSVAEVLELVQAAGLDFVALTDHNTLAQNRVACESPVLTIPGLEVTSYYGHLNILGVRELVDFRFQSVAELAPSLERAQLDGALVVLNHPDCDWCPWVWPEAPAYNLMEVWNGLWSRRNQRALERWQSLLAAGRRIPAVGGSDTHKVERLSIQRSGTPTTHVLADDLTVPAVLEALKAGRSFISDMPDGPAAWLSVDGAGPGETVPPGTRPVMVRLDRADDCLLRLIGAEGTLFEQPVGSSVVWEWEARPGGFLRAELWSQATGWPRALTNPVWVDAGP